MSPRSGGSVLVVDLARREVLLGSDEIPLVVQTGPVPFWDHHPSYGLKTEDHNKGLYHLSPRVYCHQNREGLQGHRDPL